MNEALTPESPTEETIEKWRRDTRNEWSDSGKVDAWRKWGRKVQAGLSEGTAVLLAAAQLEPGHAVIDVAGGGGDPSLTIARKVAPRGTVSVTDVSPGMLQTAKQFAVEDGITNLKTYEADTESLPFGDATFDRATCRCGVMFFPDVQAGLVEILRVLKPGGRAAFLAWGSLANNEFFSSIFGPVSQILSLSPPAPGTPSQFRFAVSGSLSTALSQAGFDDVSESEHRSSFRFSGTPGEMLQMVLDMGGLHAKLADAPDGKGERVKSEALRNFSKYKSEGQVTPGVTYVLAAGRKPA